MCDRGDLREVQQRRERGPSPYTIHVCGNYGRKLTKVAGFMDEVLFKHITINLANADVALFSAKRERDALWEYVEENETMWEPYLYTERIHMETQMLDHQPGQVVAFAEFVTSEPLPVPLYRKIIRDYLASLCLQRVSGITSIRSTRSTRIERVKRKTSKIHLIRLWEPQN